MVGATLNQNFIQSLKQILCNPSSIVELHLVIMRKRDGLPNAAQEQGSRVRLI